MGPDDTEPDASRTAEEDALFKSLTHETRRDIIRAVGGVDEGDAEDTGLTFSAIQKRLGGIDSPSLAYHLKHLQTLVPATDGAYQLSEIGDAAYQLLLKVDQTTHLAHYKRRMWHMYVWAMVLWIPTVNLIPQILFAPWGIWSNIVVIILLNAVMVVNFQVFRILQKRGRD